MELSLDSGNATYQIASYQPGSITLIVKSKPAENLEPNHTVESKQEIHNLPFVIMPEKLISPWGPKTFEELSREDFQALLEFKPQVILLGTGEKMRFLKAELFASLAQNNIGIEVMTTAAACRTYTVLMSEGRNVAAALFP